MYFVHSVKRSQTDFIQQYHPLLILDILSSVNFWTLTRWCCHWEEKWYTRTFHKIILISLSGQFLHVSIIFLHTKVINGYFTFPGNDLPALLEQIPMNTSNIHSHRDRLDRIDDRLDQHEEELGAHSESLKVNSERLEHQRERIEELEIPNCECQHLPLNALSAASLWYIWNAFACL